MGYASYRQSDGYRDNSEYHYFATHGDVEYAFNNKLTLRVEFNSMNYVNHLNGGLTDEQFHEDPRQSTRDRNYYSPTIYVPSVRLDYKIGKRTTLNFISSAILGSRNSVQFIALSTVKGTINSSLGTYNPRQVDIDH
jgi:Fe(3+) dicitrate transport protein